MTEDTAPTYDPTIDGDRRARETSRHGRSPKGAPGRKLLLLGALVIVVVAAVIVAVSVSGGHKAKRQGVPPVTVTSSPAASPQPTGFPNASDTGVPAGTELDPSGSIEVTQNGATVSNLDVKGQIDIDADDVTITDVKVTGTGMWGVIQRAGHHGLTISDSEIAGDGVHRMQYALLDQGSGTTIDRVNIHDCDNCIQATAATITSSYVHDPLFFTGAHIDMIIDEGGNGPFVVRHSTVINKYGQTSAVALFQDNGPIHNATITDNLLGGGGYTVYGGSGSKGQSTNVVITGNRFLRTLGPKGGAFGLAAYFDPAGPGNSWTGNVWDDTGQPAS